MSIRIPAPLLAPLLAMSALVAPAFAAGGKTKTISIHGHTVSDGYSVYPVISSSGRYVAYLSDATNLSTPAGDGSVQALRCDRARRTTRLVSTHGGALASNNVDSVAISGNGRFVAFRTAAANFPGSNGVLQAYRHDCKTGANVLVSADVDGDGSSAQCWPSSISLSWNGRFVVFATSANMLGGLGNGQVQLWRRDVKKGVTELVSISVAAGLADDDVLQSSVSDDGRFIAFSSFAGNLTLDDGPFEDVFVRDMKSGTTSIWSTAPGGGASNQTSVIPRISGDGRVLAFPSLASNLVAGDFGSACRVVVIDRKNGARHAVHVTIGAEDCYCLNPSLSTRGRRVAFDVVKLNTPVSEDDEHRAYAFDSASEKLREVSVDSGEVDRVSKTRCNARISGNGRFVAFDSDSPLLGADQDAKYDVFLRSLK